MLVEVLPASQQELAVQRLESPLERAQLELEALPLVQQKECDVFCDALVLASALLRNHLKPLL